MNCDMCHKAKGEYVTDSGVVCKYCFNEFAKCSKCGIYSPFNLGMFDGDFKFICDDCCNDDRTTDNFFGISNEVLNFPLRQAVAG